MPLFNWIKCTNGELEFVRKEQIQEGKQNSIDADQWRVVYDDYINKFGLSEMYKKLLELMKNKAILELEFVTSRDTFKLTEINLATAKLETMLANNGDGMTIEQSLIYISKWIGYHLNTKKLTVIEYFNLTREYGKANK